MPDQERLRADAARRIDAVEAELRRIGQWQAGPLPPDALAFHRAFGADKLMFCQWLQFVLVPRVREIIASGGEFPTSSSVGAYAVRELDGHPDAGGLIRILSEFDAMFDG